MVSSPRGRQISAGRDDAGELNGLIGPAVLGLVNLDEDLLADTRGAEVVKVECRDVGDAVGGGWAQGPQGGEGGRGWGRDFSGPVSASRARLFEGFGGQGLFLG